jgi:hypothetical protein
LASEFIHANFVRGADGKELLNRAKNLMTTQRLRHSFLNMRFS